MRIQHNISGLNANRNKTKNNEAVAKSLEKLSSGFRINRAGDDAAGLAISEKMLAQMTGLSQAQKNSEDGISLVQTADGAMEEIHSMLNRMIELADEAANGTYTENDQKELQKELEQLKEEITRIRDSTNFNGIFLLQGEEEPPKTEDGKVEEVATIKGGLPVWVEMKADGCLSEEYEISTDDGAGNITTTKHSAAMVDFSKLTSANVNDLKKEDVGFFTTCCTCERHYSIKFIDGTDNKMEQSGMHWIFSIGIDGITTGKELVEKIISATETTAGSGIGKPNGHYTNLIQDPTNPANLIVYDERPEAKPNVPSGEGLFNQGVAYEYVYVPAEEKPFEPTAVILQIGETSKEFDRLRIIRPDMSLETIGIDDIFLSSYASAANSIEKIKKGIDYVSQERGRMGAYQNRLEHTVLNLGSSYENITSSESRIRDADMAKEMMTYTKNNILVQSSQAMLAQANQSMQGILSLLQ